MDRITAYVKQLTPHHAVSKTSATAHAPSNIALCKYWGKRDTALNLPLTSSLSISLNEGTTTTISLAHEDKLTLNGNIVSPTSTFYQRLFTFVDYCREPRTFFHINTCNALPTAAGFASSASGFAALVLALNTLYQWQLGAHELSLLARLGSGSACRSLWPGFVEWHRGEREDGMDSFAEPLDIDWPEFCITPCIVTTQEKAVSSRDAMRITKETSPDYSHWPRDVAEDLAEIKSALSLKDFQRLGLAAERNAIRLHRMLHSATPSVNYDLAETLLLKQRVHGLRDQGHFIYFTQDAGPQIKLLHLKKDGPLIRDTFIF